jgi:ubiquinone/menaquinone biosynthesis C-methylase UbiE
VTKKDKIIELFFKRHKPLGKILDLGCGSGRALVYLKKGEKIEFI